MASQALYRRYRSRTFDELIGQEHVVQTLRNALAEGRIAHAYLFTGPRGVGKTTVARLLAKAVNCTTAAGERPCDECASCREIAEGRAVDVIEMDAASHTSVDDARELIERVQFRPTSTAYKVYTIDEAHMLSTAAFNALLKTLEEPPGHALFILATTEIHKVPATILSRCQRFTFNRHTIAATAAHVQRIAAEEQVTLEPGVAEAIARASTGSMRDALSVLDQLMAYGSGTIGLDQVRGLLGAAEAQEVSALVDALIGGDLSGALRAVAAVAQQGADLRQFVRDLVERLRALLLLKAGGDPALLDATADDLATLQSQAAAGTLPSFLAWVKLFSGLDYQLRTSPYGQLPLELAVVEAIAAPPAGAQPHDQTAAPAQRVATRPVPPATAPAPTPQASSAVPERRPAEATARETSSESPGDRAAASEPLLVGSGRGRGSRTPSSAGAVEPSGEPSLSGQEHERSARQTADGDNDRSLSPQWLESHWEEIVENARAYNLNLQALLRSCSPGKIEAGVATIWVKYPLHRQKLEQRQNLELIEKIILLTTGTKLLVQFETLNDQQDALSANQRRKQRAELRKDPHISAAVRIFDADIEDVEPFDADRRTPGS